MIGRMDDPEFLGKVAESLAEAEGQCHIFIDQSLHPWEAEIKPNYLIGMGVSAYVDFMFWLEHAGEDVQAAMKRGAAIGQN